MLDRIPLRNVTSFQSQSLDVSMCIRMTATSFLFFPQSAKGMPMLNWFLWADNKEMLSVILPSYGDMGLLRECYENQWPAVIIWDSRKSLYMQVDILIDSTWNICMIHDTFIILLLKFKPHRSALFLLMNTQSGCWSSKLQNISELLFFGGAYPVIYFVQKENTWLICQMDCHIFTLKACT